MKLLRMAFEWVADLVRLFKRGGLWLALAVILGGCASSYINTSPQADGMRTCAALTDALTPGISSAAAATLASNALSPSPGTALGGTPAEAMRTCADMYDALTN